MTTVEHEDEYSVAAYYCEFFYNVRARRIQPTVSAETAGRSSASHDMDNKDCDNDDDVEAPYAKDGLPRTSAGDPPSRSSTDYWIDDVWTAADEAAAEQTLQSHMNKCAISTPFVSSKQPLVRHDGVASGFDGNDDAKAWDQFYSHHGTRFFKDRHYLEKAFPEEFSPVKEDDDDDGSGGCDGGKGRTLVEIGCGVGNAILPLLESSSSSTPPSRQWSIIHGLDISEEAIQLLRNDPRFVSYNRQDKGSSDDGDGDVEVAIAACSSASSCTLPMTRRAVFGHVCDISRTVPSACVGIADVTTLLFCLSAIDPLAMPTAARRVASTLRPGGTLVIRDYGRYDEAQMKLGTSRGKQLKDNFYRKHDGTKCFYFTLQDLEALFCSTEVGLEVIELTYLRRVYENKAMGQKRRRVWVQGRFLKPLRTDGDEPLGATDSERE